MSSSKRVTCYIEHEHDGKILPIIMGFDNDANVHVSIEFKETKSIPLI